MRRILVLGSPGSGKSTLARRMGTTLGVPVVSIDQLYWDTGWKPRDGALWRAELANWLTRPTWIIDGNYISTLDERLAVADHVVWFDLPTHVCIGGITKRLVHGWGRTRPDMAAGCPERFDLEFFRYVLTFRQYIRPLSMELLSLWHGPLTILSSRRERASFLQKFPSR